VRERLSERNRRVGGVHRNLGIGKGSIWSRKERERNRVVWGVEVRKEK
jgi:hypothetical protein